MPIIAMVLPLPLCIVFWLSFCVFSHDCHLHTTW